MTLAAPPPLTDEDEVKSLLRAWHQGDPRGRVAPSALALDGVEPLPVLRVSLASICEGRGVYVRPLRPVMKVPNSPSVPNIDVWSVDGLDLPDDAPIGQRVERQLEGEVRCDCEVCRGAGHRRCSICNGTGRIGSHGRRQSLDQCPTCDGHGSQPCVTCNALGAFVGPPIVWAEIVKTTAVRVVKDDALPGEIALAIDEALEKGGGTIVVQHRGGRIQREHALGGADGYRSGPSGERYVRAVEALTAEIDGSGTARIRRQELEVRRAPAFRVKKKDGTSFYVWGHPVRVHPPESLDEEASILLWGAAIVATAIATMVGIFVYMH